MKFTYLVNVFLLKLIPKWMCTSHEPRLLFVMSWVEGCSNRFVLFWSFVQAAYYKLQFCFIVTLTISVRQHQSFQQTSQNNAGDKVL